MVDNTAVMDDGGLTVEQAAQQLQVSERTILRRIKAGKIQAHKLDTLRGEVWCVHLAGGVVMHDSTEPPASMTQDKTAVMHDSIQHPPAIVAALDLAEQLRRDNAALASRNEQLAGQVGFLQAKLQEAEKRIVLLEAPKEEPAKDTPAETEHDRPRRSWWKWWQ
jgi:excisionase family DNA binding protein